MYIDGSSSMPIVDLITCSTDQHALKQTGKLPPTNKQYSYGRYDGVPNKTADGIESLIPTPILLRCLIGCAHSSLAVLARTTHFSASAAVLLVVLFDKQLHDGTVGNNTLQIMAMSVASIMT